MNKTRALDALTALSQETRLDVFRLLVQLGPQGVPAGTIAERLGVRQNTLSAHLGVLSRGGLVSSMREGRVIRYRADYEGMGELLTYLTQDCCRGEQAICEPLIKAMSCAC